MKKRSLQKSFQKSQKELFQEDIFSNNLIKALGHSNPLDSPEIKFLKIKNMLTSRGRLATHSVIEYTILDYLYHGNLRGKKILHLGGSTGPFMKFLKGKGAKTAVIDTDHIALKDTKKRQVNAVRANAIITKNKTNHNQINPNSKNPKYLPFKENSFDILISNHFLFSNYHKHYFNDPGFEEKKQSIRTSEQSLQEFNRILKTGGRLIVVATHPEELLDLIKYKKFFKIHGFAVEKVFGENPLDAVGHNKGPGNFVLRKIEPLPHEMKKIPMKPQASNQK